MKLMSDLTKEQQEKFKRRIPIVKMLLSLDVWNDNTKSSLEIYLKHISNDKDYAIVSSLDVQKAKNLISYIE